MSTSYINAQIGIVDSESNVTVIYPITNASNVSVTANSNYTSGNTIQKVVTGLGASAFKSVENDYTQNTSGAVAAASALYSAYTALSQQIGGLDVSTDVTTIKNVIQDSTYGNSAIKTTLDSVNTNVNTVNTTIGTINTNASTASIKTTNAYNILNNDTYGNAALLTAIQSIQSFIDPVSTVNAGECIMKDYQNECTSDYGFTWAKIHKLCQNGTIGTYIKNGSYVDMTCYDGTHYKLYAHVDPYYGTGEGQVNYHHIDFISDILLPTTSQINDSSSAGSNNSASANVPAWISSKVGTNKMRNFLDNYVANLPMKLRLYLTDKIASVPTRYDSSSTLGDDNGRVTYNLGKLWLLYYKEVWGNKVGNSYKPTNANNVITYEDKLVQYWKFANDSTFRTKKLNGSTDIWWLGSARSGNNIGFCSVNSSGAASYTYPIYAYGVPLCFRVS